MWIPLLLLFCCCLQAEITALYLSWYGDPTTSMTIQWLTFPEDTATVVELEAEDGSWLPFIGSSTPLEHIRVHRVSLEDLTANTEYRFRIKDNAPIYSFQTAPTELQEEPLRFCIGGDLYHSVKLFRKMSQTVMAHNPHFVVIGGDLAYALGSKPSINIGLKRWIAFLKDWHEHMVTSSGRIVPFLIVPGNHDVKSDDYETFFTLFAFPQKQLYRAVDFGNYLSLILLDTGHFQPIHGRQTLWLKKNLESRLHIPYRFAIYHEGAYPSHYSFDGPAPTDIRANWVPLFEKYDLSAAFEHHNHAYKKTYPLKEGKFDETGVTYFGDGSWGASPRKPKDFPYLAKRAKTNSIFIVELNQKEGLVEAFDLRNHSIDKIYFK
jgi:hypothetical protein